MVLVAVLRLLLCITILQWSFYTKVKAFSLLL
jgi:hypothetical protein